MIRCRAADTYYARYDTLRYDDITTRLAVDIGAIRDINAGYDWKTCYATLREYYELLPAT